MGDSGDHSIRHNDREYTDRLLGTVWWKSLIRTDAIYGRNAGRAVSGRVLDIGCGIGRLHPWLGEGAVGVDTNPHSVAVARDRGVDAYTPAAFMSSEHARPGSFQTLLFAHVLEHMSPDEASELVASYLSFLVPGGRVVAIVPQEAGFSSDPTHVAMVDLPELENIASANGLRMGLVYSFPFPRTAGRLFKYNETVALLSKSA